MCGIAGAVGRLAPDDLARLATSLGSAVRHRGPDGRGLWVAPDAGVALAHRRLAVVGLGEQGHQPMTSADGAVTVTFNGELYDHAQHRERLRDGGLRLRGGSDTEVLVELMARHGVVETLPLVDGMFALAAWDRRRRRLVLARDRMGEKPLYWVGGPRVVTFCSEARALAAVPGAGRELDRRALAAYLRRGFVTGDRGILDGVRRLPPGHWVAVDEDGRLDGPNAWWRAADVAEAGWAAPLPRRQAADTVEDALRDAVRGMLVADVPVGAFLSGGVDSTLVCALAQQVSSRPVSTFTVGFDQPDDGTAQAGVDESGAAAAVARALGTSHHTLRVGPTDAHEALAGVVAVHDEPFADPSAVPTALLCRAARRHVTVCLSGDGADEVLAGYNRYRATTGPLATVLRLPRPVRAGAAAALGAVPARGWDAVGRRAPSALSTRVLPSDLAVKAHKLGRVLRAGDGAAAYDALAGVLAPDVLLAHPGDALGHGTPVPESPLPAGLSPLRRAMLRDQLTTLPDDMLVKVDRASMAVALEVRVPFLHRAVVEAAARVADADLVARGRPKSLLREVVARHVPPQLVDRPKRGFDPPLGAWLRGPLRAATTDLLSADRLRRQGLLDPRPVSALVEQHLSGRRDHAYALWTLLVLQSWLDDVR